MIPVDFAAFNALPCRFETLSLNFEREWDQNNLLFAICFSPKLHSHGVTTACIARSIKSMYARLHCQDHEGITRVARDFLWYGLSRTLFANGTETASVFLLNE